MNNVVKLISMCKLFPTPQYGSNPTQVATISLRLLMLKFVHVFQVIIRSKLTAKLLIYRARG